MNKDHWSRIPGFFQSTIAQRRQIIESLPLGLSEQDLRDGLDASALSLEQANLISENVIGLYALPFSVVPNFLIDDRSAIIPMVTEEPSVVAACGRMAKIVAQAGGFKTEGSPSLMEGQIQVFDLPDVEQASLTILTHKKELIEQANERYPKMLERGGGCVDLEVRILPKRGTVGSSLIVIPLVDCLDAMGANLVIGICEELSLPIQKLISGRLGARIVSNLCDKRLFTAICEIPFWLLSTNQENHDDGALVAQKMFVVHSLAEEDPYRAATHNKGILNGIDAVALATGNDFRAIEAAAHAYAGMGLGYRPLTQMQVNEETKQFEARLTLPLAVGVVGGLSKTHPSVQTALRLLGDFGTRSGMLSRAMACVGLAQCMAALNALATEGISKGHMKLHQRKYASVAKENGL